MTPSCSFLQFYTLLATALKIYLQYTIPQARGFPVKHLQKSDQSLIISKMNFINPELYEPYFKVMTIRQKTTLQEDFYSVLVNTNHP